MTCQPVKGHSAINTNQLNIIQLFNYPKEKKKKKRIGITLPHSFNILNIQHRKQTQIELNLFEEAKASPCACMQKQINH